MEGGAAAAARSGRSGRRIRFRGPFVDSFALNVNCFGGLVTAVGVVGGIIGAINW